MPIDQISPLPEVVRFGREICGDLMQAERREWWLANGLGAYASGTLAGSLTRRYHGLLIAPVYPPLGRSLALAKADAILVDGAHTWPLFTNRWASGAVSPAGNVHIESFRLEGRMPEWRYAVGAGWVEQRIWMEYGANSTYVAWRFEPLNSNDRHPRALRVSLLANNRDHHGTTWPGHYDPVIEADARHLRVMQTETCMLHVRTFNGQISPAKKWVENFELYAERQRGLDSVDNHLCVGEAELEMKPGQWTGLVASLEASASPDLLTAMGRARRHDRAVLDEAGYVDAPHWVEHLALAADSFLFARPLPAVPDGESVIAGYPWFGDWGRDTMIALPGLTLATGRHASALRILETFARFLDRGMLPNTFPGAGEQPEYNTVDAALWYFEAWRAYVEATGDHAALRRVFPLLESMIDWHFRGTRYGIGIDPADGLLRAGEPGVQLTWMDAKIGDRVITPRIGKPVEINALWYNALQVMTAFAAILGEDTGRYATFASQTDKAFQVFVKSGGGLFDVVDGPEGDDATVRPNQIFAVSLPHSPLSAEQQAGVVDQCARELFTSLGLRSLAPDHRDYRPRYSGGVEERDSAYHQGPVWGWLLGHFALAVYRVHGDAAAAQALLAPVAAHLTDAGLGTISEIFDADPPHTPRGAPAQAWSVACTLEAWSRLEQEKRTANRHS